MATQAWSWHPACPAVLSRSRIHSTHTGTQTSAIGDLDAKSRVNNLLCLRHTDSGAIGATRGKR